MSDIKFVLFLVAICCILLGLLGLVIRAAVRGSTRPPAAEDDAGPGVYEISGVRQADASDVVVRIEAASIDNARVKAGLAGIHVTRIKPVSGSASQPADRKQQELARAARPSVRAKDLNYRE